MKKFKTLVIDIEANNLLAPLLDYSSMPYKLKPEAKLWCISIRDVETKDTLLFVNEDYIDVVYPPYYIDYFNDDNKLIKKEWYNHEKHLVHTDVKLNLPFTIKSEMTLDEEVDWYNKKEKFIANKDNLKLALSESKIIIGHNIINYDLPMLMLFDTLDYTVGFPGKSSTLFGRDIAIVDTLILSKVLWPDRQDTFGRHSLDAFGKRTGNYKLPFNDFSHFTPHMCFYCDQDTDTNVSAYEYLNLEKQEDDWNERWDEAFALESKLIDLTLKQEVVGFELDVELCHKNLEELDKLLTEREETINPRLPPKPLNKTESNYYSPPNEQFKKDGCLSSSIINFANKMNEYVPNETKDIYSIISHKLTISDNVLNFEAINLEEIQIISKSASDEVKELLSKIKWKFNKAKNSIYCKLPESLITPVTVWITDLNYSLTIEHPKTLTPFISAVPSEDDPDSFQYFLLYDEKEMKLPVDPTVPVKTSTVATVKDNEHIKLYLLSLGWLPTEWSDRDLTKDSSKKPLSPEKVVETIHRYAEKTFNTGFKEPRLREMNLPLNLTQEEFVDNCLQQYRENSKKPIKVVTSPKIKVGPDKEVDENLLSIENNKEFSIAFAEYTTYKHRRSSIAGGDIDEETGEPSKGYLSNYRTVDNRIPTPADTIGAGTYRYTHKVVANVPRSSSIFGAQMRSLFKAGKNWVQAAFDFASLEARIEGHHVIGFPGGPELVESLLAEKGLTLETSFDIHSMTAKALNITRDNAKGINYGILYGAQWPKLKKMLGITDAEAKKMYNDFWDSMPALKQLKENLENYWVDTGKRYIEAIDGRKIKTRSAHSLLNFLFQGNGAIMSKWSAVRIAEQFESQGLLGDPFKHTEEDVKVWQMILYHDEVQYAIHRKLMKVKVFDKLTETEEEDFKLANAKYKKLSPEEKMKTTKPQSVQQIKEQEYIKTNENLGQFAEVGHLDDGRSYIGIPGIFSETLVKGVEIACEERKMKVPLGISWITGANWKQCH